MPYFSLKEPKLSSSFDDSDSDSPCPNVHASSSNSPISSSLVKSETKLITNGASTFKSSKSVNPFTTSSNSRKNMEQSEPDWDKLLFGCMKTFECKEILEVPELDTSFVDCTLAEDAALKLVTGFDFPVLNLNNTNIHKVNGFLKSICETFPSVLDQAIALTVMLDFVSCCFQEGNFFSQFPKYKVPTKCLLVSRICDKIESVLKSSALNRCPLAQVKSMEKLVMASMARIPTSMAVSSNFLKYCFAQKIHLLERRDKSKAVSSVYNYDSDDQDTSPAKKRMKTNVASTSKTWKTEELEFKLAELPSRGHLAPPSLNGSSFTVAGFDSEESVLARPLSPSPSSISEAYTPFKRVSIGENESGRFTSTPESNSTFGRFNDLSSGDEDFSSKAEHYAVRDAVKLNQVKQKILTSKKNSAYPNAKGISDTTLKPYATKTYQSSDSEYKPSNSDYSSDDSLPSITFHHETKEIKSPLKVHNSSNILSAPSGKAVAEDRSPLKNVQTNNCNSKQIQKSGKSSISPYKTKMTTWSAKYDSPPKWASSSSMKSAPQSCVSVMSVKPSDQSVFDKNLKRTPHSQLSPAMQPINRNSFNENQSGKSSEGSASKKKMNTLHNYFSKTSTSKSGH